MKLPVRAALIVGALVLVRDVVAQSETTAPIGAGSQPTVDTYTVQPGDSLWAITSRVLSNPYLWPKVWAFNPEITNPNWIYPGDVIRFFPSHNDLPALADLSASPKQKPQPEVETPEPEGTPASAEATMPAEPGKTAEGHHGPTIEVVDTRPPPVERMHPSEQWWAMVSSFVTPKELAEAGTLVHAPSDRMLLSSGDVVYLKFPKDQKPDAGQIYMSYQTVAKVSHPIEHTLWGYMTRVTGVMTIEGSEGDLTRARVSTSLAEIERGNYVTPLKQDLLMPITPIKAKAKIDGYVLALWFEAPEMAAEQQVAFIDKGSRDGIERGYRMVIRADGDPVTQDGELGQKVDIGTLLVLDAKETASTCLVLKSVKEIEPGYRVQAITQ